MNTETQAHSLAILMQKRKVSKKEQLSKYELLLPLVTVKKSDLDRLMIGDVFLLGLSSLECILIKDNSIHAQVVLTQQNNRYCFKVENNYQQRIVISTSKKYESVLFILGSLYIDSLEVGHTIDISKRELKDIIVMHKENKIANASLVNSEGELAVQIDKVKRNE